MGENCISERYGKKAPEVKSREGTFQENCSKTGWEKKFSGSCWRLPVITFSLFFNNVAQENGAQVIYGSAEESKSTQKC